MMEIFFGIITRQAIRRGSYRSVENLIAAIETFIDGWNEHCQPFVWTKTADDILTKATRKKTSNTRHRSRRCHGRVLSFAMDKRLAPSWLPFGFARARTASPTPPPRHSWRSTGF